MLTYILYKTQTMLLSAISRKGHQDGDLQPVQKPCSCQQQTEKASQIGIYSLFKTQIMLLSAENRKGQPAVDLQPVQCPDHALVSSKQKRSARCWLTSCSKPRVCSYQQQAKGQPDVDLHPVQSPEHALVSNSGKIQPDADLQPVQNPEHGLVSNKQEGPARWWLTSCSKPRAWSCQQQVGRASQVLTYNLFKTQSTLLSATSRKSQPGADLQTVQNPDHALVSNKQAGPGRCWLTSCSKPRAGSCQQLAGRARQMHTYNLFITQNMLLLATSRKGQPDADLQTVVNPEHALVSKK